MCVGERSLAEMLPFRRLSEVDATSCDMLAKGKDGQMGLAWRLVVKALPLYH
jgi:hypothetical protein